MKYPWMKDMRINKRPDFDPPDIPKDEGRNRKLVIDDHFIRLWNGPLSVAEIAARKQVSVSAVYKATSKAGLPKRKRTHRSRKDL